MARASICVSLELLHLAPLPRFVLTPLLFLELLLHSRVDLSIEPLPEAPRDERAALIPKMNP